MTHILGLITLVSQIGVGTFVGAYLIHTGRRPYTWQRKLRVPKVAGELHLGSGSDYVGVV